jgi:hypothetical protein
MNNVMMFEVQNQTTLNDITRCNYDSKKDKVLLQRQMDAIKSSIVFYILHLLR